MLDTNRKTFQTHPSLLPLRTALITAKGETPACPPRIDPDERLAARLIEKMKTEYAKPLPFAGWKDDSISPSFRLQKVIGSNV